MNSEPQGVLCKRIERPVKQNKILVVTMATFMDKEEHEALWSLLLLYLNIYWLAALVESGVINFFSREEQINGDEVSPKGSQCSVSSFNEVGTFRWQKNVKLPSLSREEGF